MADATPAIPFNRPVPLGRSSTRPKAPPAGHLGDGSHTRLVTELRSGNWHQVLLITSCTHALEMAAWLLTSNPGRSDRPGVFNSSSTIMRSCFAGVAGVRYPAGR
jgi:hypothetical protein